jgi:hypothetical protein
MREAGMPRVRGVERERGWAGELLTWRQAPLWLEAETGRAKYFVAAGQYEVVAWAEVRDWGGRQRVNIGTFRTVAEAKTACEQHAAARLSREPKRGPSM